ncbi:MAG TPA: DNA repair protein RecO [Rhizomicrobium sp.]|jgi:DNA repair protein RecO (recombination protein O)|nr:DNA repair protein RecO [Rhizomicrobium sp.]
MEWTDDAVVLSVRPHGESAAILETLTRLHGRHLGLVRGGASRRTRPVLQPGNALHLHWRARLGDHLGSFTAELVKARAGDMLDSREALAGLNAFSAVASAALPEREAHAGLFEAADILLDAMRLSDFAHWGALYVRWEAGLLEELGFGLDLTRCAATGALENLIYVSPRTGRAVCGDAGALYKERLFALPGFLLGSQNASPDAADVLAGLKLTAHFLAERVLRPHGKDMPQARLRLDGLANRESH